MTLKFWTNGIDFVVAESAEDAKKVVVETTGYDDEDELEGDGWSAYDDEDEITWREEIDEKPYERNVVKKAKDFVAEGRGYMGSTEY